MPTLGGCLAPAEGDDPSPASSSADDDDDSSGTTSLPPPADSSTTGVTPDGSSGSSTAAADESTSTTGEGFDDPGCPECIVLADGLMSGRGIAVDVDHVYWTDQEAGTVHRILKGGGDGGMIAAAQNDPYGIAVADGQVYWTNFHYDGGVFSVPVTGGAPTMLSEEEYPRSIVVQDGQIYWGTFQEFDGRLVRMPVAQDEPPTLLEFIDGGIADLVVDGDQMFFTAHTFSNGMAFIMDPNGPILGSVFSMALGGGSPSATELVANLAEPWGIARSGDRVVWVNGMEPDADQPRSVLSMPSAGGPVEVHANGQTAPWDVAVDEQYVYWTDYDEVWAVSLEGGEPILLAELQNRARSIVVDDQWVFWVTRERVLQRAKP